MLKISKEHQNLTSQLVPAPFTLHIDNTIRSYIDQGRLGRVLYFCVNYQSSPVASSKFLHWRRNRKYSGENTMVLGIIYESILHNSFLINEKNGILLSLYVGIGPALISYLLWIKAIKIIGANNSSLFLNLIPIFSSIISIIFLNELLKVYHIIGAFLIFTGIFLVTKNYINEKN